MLAEVMSNISADILFDWDSRIGPIFASRKGWAVFRWTNRLWRIHVRNYLHQAGDLA